MAGSERWTGSGLAWRAGPRPSRAVLPSCSPLHALYFGTFTAAGADAYGYMSQAYGWARGELPGPPRVALALPLRESDALQMPLGYRGGREPHSMVPTYAPGMPLLMAVFLVFGACGPYLVVPATAALLVWAVFVWARRTIGSTGALLAAVVVTVTPVVLWQAILPMSDVPAGAAWTVRQCSRCRARGAAPSPRDARRRWGC